MVGSVPKFMEKYGNGWSFIDPAGRVPQIVLVLNNDIGGWYTIESGPADFPDDDNLYARIIAELATRVERLEAEKLDRKKAEPTEGQVSRALHMGEFG